MFKDKNSVEINNNSNEIRSKTVIKDKENPLIQNAKRRASFLNINDFFSTLGRGIYFLIKCLKF